MALCLGHPQHGYYMTRDPFGQAGDFTTAPEISQVFGELIGIWCAQVWQSLGKPPRFSLVELGPGRGTLMQDALRASRKIAGFADTVQIHLVEISPVLRKVQEKAVGPAQWHGSISTLPHQPSIIIANEFFDALPVKQYEQENGLVYERVVGLQDGKLGFGRIEAPSIKPFGKDGIFEISHARLHAAVTLGQVLKAFGGASLIIDYGHRKSAMGDTLQAMKDHQFCNITDSPGEIDITSHVDFEQLGVGFASGRAHVHPVITQAEFLNAMGLSLRGEALARKLEGQDREDFHQALKRLADDTEMGQLFKVLAATSPGLATPFPFEDA